VPLQKKINDQQPFRAIASGERTRPRVHVSAPSPKLLRRSDPDGFTQTEKVRGPESIWGRQVAAATAPQMSEDLLTLFRKTGALLDGHFVLRSGLHSRQYFQCAILLQHTEIAAKVCGWLADKLREFDCDSVISPALGGIIVGQEVGRALGKRHIFVEKEDGKLVLRRGFQIAPSEKFIVVEDVVTRGGRVQETIDIVRAPGGIVSAVGVILDRSGQAKPDFGCPFVSLMEMNVETFPADKLPPELAKIPAVKPGSK
jgi:orotate phosphoribosyltransferase